MSGILELLEWDWAQTRTGIVLHHVANISDEESFERARSGSGWTTCGVMSHLCVPGIFSRLGARRCRSCCLILGVPEGVGSPKNDEALVPWVVARLSPTEEAT